MSLKTNIVLSTYNGEQYLAEQVESILAQTYQDWNLLIRDDGSTDKTPEIIQKYCEKDSRIHFINPDEHVNVGLVSSFYRLVKHEKADIYFFSDQDDVWLPEKIEQSLAEHEKHKSLPCMVYTDLKVVDAELNLMKESYLASNPYINQSLKAQILTNNVVGGVSSINHALVELWTTELVFIHDWYLGLLAAAFGKLAYLDKPGELYRQHGKNVSGANEKISTSEAIKASSQQSDFFGDYWKYLLDIKQLSSELLRTQGDKLSPENRQLIENYVRLDEGNFLKRLKVFKYRRKNPRATLIFWFLYLTQIGRKK